MLHGITAVVTGASRGIGREITRTLASEGANVAVLARGKAVHETVAQIEQNVGAISRQMDVTNEDAVESLIEDAVNEFGGIDCLVNNAGIRGPIRPVEDTDLADWQETIDTNLTGAFLLCKHATPHLRDSEQASIVNISSIAGKRPSKNRIAYTTSKIALIGLTRTLAVELGDDEVTVNTICPGPVRGDRLRRSTELQAEKWGVSYESAKNRFYLEDVALPEIIDPEEIADFVAYLASEKARHITAQDINIDAGSIWY